MPQRDRVRPAGMSDTSTRTRAAHARLAWLKRARCYGLFVNDKATVLMERDRLVDLVHATARPGVSAHTIRRSLLEYQGRLDPLSPEIDDDDDDESVSPLAVFVVLAMLLTVFVAVARL